LIGRGSINTVYINRTITHELIYLVLFTWIVLGGSAWQCADDDDDCQWNTPTWAEKKGSRQQIGWALEFFFPLAAGGQKWIETSNFLLHKTSDTNLIVSGIHVFQMLTKRLEIVVGTKHSSNHNTKHLTMFLDFCMVWLGRTKYFRCFSISRVCVCHILPAENTNRLFLLRGLRGEH